MCLSISRNFYNIVRGGSILLQDYSILKDKIYIWLLVYYNNKKIPNNTALGREIGANRNTVASHIKKLVEKGYLTITEDKIVLVNNFLNLDEVIIRDYLETTSSYSAVDLYQRLMEDNEIITKAQMAQELGMCRESVYHEAHSVVYAIVYEGKIRYVGCSNRFEARRRQHKEKRPFLTDDNFIIMYDNVGKNLFAMERELIRILQPEWNIALKY